MQEYVSVPGSGERNIVPKTADHHSLPPSGNAPPDKVDIPKMKRSMSPLPTISKHPIMENLRGFIAPLPLMSKALVEGLDNALERLSIFLTLSAFNFGFN